MKQKRFLLFVLCCAVVSGLVLGFLASLSWAQEQYYVTNDEVLKILKSGQGEALAIKQITDCPVRFTFTKQDLERLHNAGASGYLLQLMRSSQDLQVKIDTGQVHLPPTPCWPGNISGSGTSASTPETNAWHGLTLDKSTPADAIAALGQPEHDKSGQRLSLLLVASRFEWQRVCADKVFRVLEYKKPIAGMKEARLTFLNDKLVLVHLSPKGDLDPNQLPQDYGVQFFPTEEINEVERLELEDRVGVTRIDESGLAGGVVRGLRSSYYLYTKSDERYPHSHVWAEARKKPRLSAMFSGRQHLGEWPGWVKEIQLISSSLESHASRDILK